MFRRDKYIDEYGHQVDPLFDILEESLQALMAMYTEFGESFPKEERVAVDMARDVFNGEFIE